MISYACRPPFNMEDGSRPIVIIIWLWLTWRTLSQKTVLGHRIVKQKKQKDVIGGNAKQEVRPWDTAEILIITSVEQQSWVLAWIWSEASGGGGRELYATAYYIYVL